MPCIHLFPVLPSEVLGFAPKMPFSIPLCAKCALLLCQDFHLPQKEIGFHKALWGFCSRHNKYKYLHIYIVLGRNNACYFLCFSIIKKKDCCMCLLKVDSLKNSSFSESYGRGSWIRTNACRIQSPKPYHLAIPLFIT